MLFNNGLSLRYHRFRTHHEHNYPISFFLIGLIKFVLELIALCAVFLGLVMLVAKMSDGDKPGFLSKIDFAGFMEQGTDAVGSTDSTAGRLATADSARLASVNKQPESTEYELQKIINTGAEQGLDADLVAAVHNHEWILTRPRAHFVIQLASSPRLDKLLDFSTELENEATVSIFPFKVSASDNLLYYGISVGEFTTLQLAMDAVAGFPKTTTRYSPWIRKVSDVQKDINSVADRPEFQSVSTTLGLNTL